MDHATRKSFSAVTTLFQFSLGFTSGQAKSYSEENKFRN